MTRRVLAAALLAAAACAPARGPAPYGGQRPELCYALDYAGEGAALFPVRIGVVGTHGWVVGIPSREGRRFWRMFRGGGTTRPFTGDSADVSFSNGFSALMLRLHADGDRVAGEAWFASDVVPDTLPPRAAVTGRRIPCDPNDRW